MFTLLRFNSFYFVNHKTTMNGILQIMSGSTGLNVVLWFSSKILKLRSHSQLIIFTGSGAYITWVCSTDILTVRAVFMIEQVYSFNLDFCFVWTGDGGNDVSMIQAADVGVGILGKVSLNAVLHWKTSFWWLIVISYEDVYFIKRFFSQIIVIGGNMIYNKRAWARRLHPFRN